MKSIAQIIAFLLVLLPLCNNQQRQIFIDYGAGGQGIQIMKLLFDVKDAFYVDVGAYDPIFASNTLNLYAEGWRGINIDASPERINRFFLMRPDQINLNIAVGQQDEFMTLYELQQDSSSTVSKRVKDYLKSSKPLVAQIKVPSLTLKQICQRFYTRRPIFMNIDAEGFGGRILDGNDWTNIKCVPFIIISQINQEITQSGMPIPNEILRKNGYVKLNYNVGLNEIYILQQQHKSYIQKRKALSEHFNNVDIKNIQFISYTVARNIRSSTTVVKHYEPTIDRMAHKFVSINEIVDLNKQNDRNNRLLIDNNFTFSNRPIIIYHFHPKSNVLLVGNGSTYTNKTIQIQGLTFWNINVTQKNGKTFSVFVLDHRFKNQSGLLPRIIDLNKDSQIAYKKQMKKSKMPLNTTSTANLSKDDIKQLKIIQKLIQQITKTIQNQTNVMARVEKGQANQTANLMVALTNNHNVQMKILQNVSKRSFDMQKLVLQKIQKKQKSNKQQPQQDDLSKRLNKKSKTLNKQIQILVDFQKIMIGLICIMSISLCVTICVKRSKMNKIKIDNINQSSKQK